MQNVLQAGLHPIMPRPICKPEAEKNSPCPLAYLLQEVIVAASMSADIPNTAGTASKVTKEVAAFRDTVESVGIAVVLAFVLRAFLIEAFVIPTGSMAPRLMGEHWRLQCPVCEYRYDHGWIGSTPDRSLLKSPTAAQCPNCNRDYTKSRGPARPVDGGDRVLVLKYLYNFRQPKPWDVVVFRNPQNNSENYIKRLIGLPGETIEIVQGNIWVKTRDDAAWTIRRKPPDVQEVMWQTIHDNDYQPVDAESASYPKWFDYGKTGLWRLDGQQGRCFTFEGGKTSAGLSFRGMVQDSDDRWSFLPHYGYNNVAVETDRRANEYLWREVCTDLRLSFVYTPQAGDSRIVLMFDVMAKGYAAEVSADGKVRLLHRPGETSSLLADQGPADLAAATGWTTWKESQLPPLKIWQGHQLSLTNVDYRLTLWIDGEAVLQSSDEDFPADYQTVRDRMLAVYRNEPDAQIPTPQVAIAAAGGPCQLRHVKLDRDVYYTHTRLEVSDGPQWDYARNLPPEIAPKTNQPGWGVTGHPIRLNGDPSSPNDLDSFYVLGDNSPQSHDSRRWTQAAPTLRLYEQGRRVYQLGTVPRYNIIGKAVFVYWPSGFRLPGLARLPIVPNVGDMRRVR